MELLTFEPEQLETRRATNDELGYIMGVLSLQNCIIDDKLMEVN